MLGLSYANNLSPRLESKLATLFTPSPSRVGHPGDPYTGVVVGGAEEVGGAEDVAASVTTLVASIKGADETGTVSAEEGRTTVGWIGSMVSVVTGRG